jgi:hypothetical protein
MRIASVILSLSFIGVLTGTTFGQAREPPSPVPAPAPPTPQPQLPRKLTPEDKAAIKDLFNEAVTTGIAHPFQITCSATTGNCNPSAVFISAATISTIKINEIPTGTTALTVRITAGETDKLGESLIVRRTFSQTAIPDQIVIAVHRARRLRETYGTSGATNMTPAKAFCEAQSAPTLNDDPAIGFVSLGGSETLAIQLTMTGASNTPTLKTIMATMNYQRWFIDMGGFLTFGFVSDQELVMEDAAPGTVRILKKRRTDKIVPGTGIVLNFHPANYPGLAAQFGIATSVDRAASYYMGFGYRLRELGPKTLATFAAGIAATQVRRFPDVKPGDIRSATATTVTQGSNRYAFGPYLSLSLGFSFGGVETPPAAAPVTN